MAESLITMAARAAGEIGADPDMSGEHPNLKAFIDKVNKLVDRPLHSNNADVPLFDVDFWIAVARHMGERFKVALPPGIEEHVAHDLQEIESDIWHWTRGMAGVLSLGLVRRQHQIGPSELAELIQNFCYAVMKAGSKG